MIESTVTVAYQTTVEIKRSGPVGRLLGWLGEHPLKGGLTAGIAVVAFAALRASEGVRSEPLIAAGLSLVVIVTWILLFFLMRNFFQEQSHAHLPVLRKIELSKEHARWTENEKTRKEIPNPRIRILSTEVPSGREGREKNGKPTPWPVWLVIDDKEGDMRLIFETRDSADKASKLEKITAEEINVADERLPRAVLLPILSALSPSD